MIKDAFALKQEIQLVNDLTRSQYMVSSLTRQDPVMQINQPISTGYYDKFIQ